PSPLDLNHARRQPFRLQTCHNALKSRQGLLWRRRHERLFLGLSLLHGLLFVGLLVPCGDPGKDCGGQRGHAPHHLPESIDNVHGQGWNPNGQSPQVALYALPHLSPGRRLALQFYGVLAGALDDFEVVALEGNLLGSLLPFFLGGSHAFTPFGAFTPRWLSPMRRRPAPPSARTTSPTASIS